MSWGGRGGQTADYRYHGEADVCLLEGGAIVGPVSRHGHHLSGLPHRAVDDTWGGDKRRLLRLSWCFCAATPPPPPTRGAEGRLGPTFDQRVFIGGGGAGQDAQLGPHLVQALLLHLEVKDERDSV